MKVVFMGSGRIAVPSLERLLKAEGLRVPLVVTAPDRPGGRKRRLRPCPVKARALELECAVWTPEKPGHPASMEMFRSVAPDVFAVAAYGQYLPRRVLDLAPHGGINMHPSLLPRYRGAAPIPWTLVNGDEETGVTIIEVAEKMDAGDILLQERLPVDPEDTTASLEDRLGVLGARMLEDAVRALACGTAAPRPQEESAATSVRKLRKEDGRIDWTLGAEEIRNRIRAFNPWPACFCFPPCLEGEPLKILRAEREQGCGCPGEVLRVSGRGPQVACGSGALCLTRVQPPGKRPMSGGDFINGHEVPPGERWG
ncbi:methionyl-tRNA formyltransferase [Kiritimatiella glycovorans]|uniref:Methionyl-tRNA formyltransferase n=1 Tax=Kiritimatiella glycovorans TaxID=1307763 RepID=A0A0G3EB02_9BACT|nr:methionyl-tRNA formyltransferase [Kiritimatiella glycovorans]AKJ63453.1 Methionyl-tRNA formyltransferase [Kiritimatiella glycovorans]